MMDYPRIYLALDNIKGEKLLKAILASYEAPVNVDLPPRSKNIYLSFEIFASPTEYRFDIVGKLKGTLSYWRQFIPEDGLPLDRLVSKLS